MVWSDDDDNDRCIQLVEMLIFVDDLPCTTICQVLRNENDQNERVWEVEVNQMKERVEESCSIFSNVYPLA